jgi:NADH dehydrogenase [ubiquinone] 1 alpha subcomplex assembly factor 1
MSITSPRAMPRPPGAPKVLFDFAEPTATGAWHAIDDRVMGGVSHSRLRAHPDGHAVFEGEVSLERRGGFASVRSSPGERGLPGAQACRVDVRGHPRAFKLSLLLDDGFDSLSFQADFTPAGSHWLTVHLPLAAFRARFRGRDLPDAPPLDPARIRQVGLMIAARQAGVFSLDIRRIALA